MISYSFRYLSWPEGSSTIWVKLIKILLLFEFKNTEMKTIELNINIYVRLFVCLINDYHFRGHENEIVTNKFVKVN